MILKGHSSHHVLDWLGKQSSFYSKHSLIKSPIWQLIPCRRWRSHSWEWLRLGGEVAGSGLSLVVKERVTLGGGGNGSEKWEQKKGKGGLRWAREVKCVFDSSTTRRLAFEINVQHMWRPVKNQEEECWEGATKHPFRPRSDTASLSRVCFGCLHCSITKPAGLFGKKMGGIRWPPSRLGQTFDGDGVVHKEQASTAAQNKFTGNNNTFSE